MSTSQTKEINNPSCTPTATRGVTSEELKVVYNITCQ